MDMILSVAVFLLGGGMGFFIATRMSRRDETGGLARLQLAETKEKLAALEQEIRAYTTQIGALNADKAALEGRMKDQHSMIERTQAQFQLTFENMANRIFEEKNAQSKANLKEILHPLKENLEGFKKHINDSFGAHAKEQFALKKEIENIVTVSNEMKFQTESLAKALKGDSKVQGNWGEVMLERILEASGLRRGEDYIPQAADMGLKHPEHGGTQKPDMVVLLPEGKHAVIDAKVSLTAYERFCGEEDEAARAVHLAEFLRSVRAHAKGLEERRYQDTPGLDTPDYVLMFMPIEGAYALAMQQDGELHAYAWDRKVIIVCPSTLFAILKIIASMWKLERQNKNAEKIAQRGGLLYDKIAGFAADMLNLGKKLDAAQGDYANALDKLSRGRGNMLGQAETLRDLGVKHMKTLPQQLIQNEEELLEAPKDVA